MVSKPKICQSCGAEFTPFNTLQKACSIGCAIKLGKETDAKAEQRARKAETRKERERLKGRAEYTREAQAAFNRYVRARDHAEPCISCGRHHQGQYHAGHYLSVGSHPELRFHPWNNHKQCQPCNTHLSGNQIRYRARLIEKIGIEAVEWLEGPHVAQNWSMKDLQEIKDFYRQQIKLIENK